MDNQLRRWGIVGALLGALGGTAVAVRDHNARQDEDPMSIGMSGEIAAQFNANGSHKWVQWYIKTKIMEKPATYEHIATSYTDRGAYLEVTTRFRGQNAAGALVTRTVRAKATGSTVFDVRMDP